MVCDNWNWFMLWWSCIMQLKSHLEHETESVRGERVGELSRVQYLTAYCAVLTLGTLLDWQPSALWFHPRQWRVHHCRRTNMLHQHICSLLPSPWPSDEDIDLAKPTNSAISFSTRATAWLFDCTKSSVSRHIIATEKNHISTSAAYNQISVSWRPSDKAIALA